MSEVLRIILLAYPDNPVGPVFLRTLLDAGLSVQGLVLEEKPNTANRKRLIQKIRKDGFSAAFQRIRQMAALRARGNRIADLAESRRIPVYSFEDMNSRTCADVLETLQPDLLAIASAPILKERIFNRAKMACLNPHPGWLPKYRGLGANAYAIRNGDAPGVTIHAVDAGIDTGRILVREHVPVMQNDTIAKINDRAMARGAELMAAVIRDIPSRGLKFLDIDEPRGKLYPAMPYRDARMLNRRLKKQGDAA